MFLRAFRLPALRSLGELADRAPVIAIDTREREPLAIAMLMFNTVKAAKMRRTGDGDSRFGVSKRMST